MLAFEQKFVPRDGRKSLFKRSFIIVTSQLPPVQDTLEIGDSRTWTTSVYQGVYFNEYVKFQLSSDIKKRIIIRVFVFLGPRPSAPKIFKCCF